MRVFDEEPRSRNKAWLWRKVAWRIQALELGGLSERALARAQELARDADVRVRVPSGAFDPAPGTPTRVVPVRAVADPRIPPAGTVLVRPYKGTEMRVLVLEQGFEFDGEVFASLTAVAERITGSHWSGAHFFGLRRAKAK